MRRAALLTLLLLGAAVPFVAASCGSSEPTAAPAQQTGPPTYYGHVGSILNEHCAGCHTEGGVAPFRLDRERDASRYARAVAAIVKTGLMPPWPPGPDSERFVGQEARRLDADELAAIDAWAAAGAPAGKPRTLARPASTSLPPGSQVRTLVPPKPYTPRAEGGGLDDYHCFLLDPKLDRDTYVTGASIRPSATSLVHHVILFEAAGAQVDAADRMNAASNGEGWTCFGGPGLPADLDGGGAAGALRFGAPQWIAAWVPGHVTDTLPDGLGVLVHAGSKIVMQVHYNLVHGTQPDRSRAVLTTAPEGAKLEPLETMLLGAPVELPCPGGASAGLCDREAAIADNVRKYGAGAGWIPAGLLLLCRKTLADYAGDVGAGRRIQTSCDRTVTQQATIRGVAGHMHLRGRDISVVLDPGTAKERTLLHIPKWDFHWQDAYYLEHPVTVSPGQTLRLSCTFDNSTAAQAVVDGKPLAPRYVVWGEGTTDEMCLGLLTVTLD